MEIYYFSGTGNSRMVARDLADALGARLVDIPMTGNGPVLVDAQVIGIVFPVYFEELPQAVKHFVRRLHAAKNTYIFSVCTYGGAAGKAVRQLRHELERTGFRLSAAYGAPMPQNSFRKPRENRKRIMDGWHRRLPVIAQRTRARDKGMRFFNWPVEAAVSLIYPVVIRPAVKRHLAGLARLPRSASMARLVRRADMSYAVSEACTGCGLCVKVCPAGDISMEGGKPMWHGGCELCTRCYHMCPEKAITGGVVEPGFYYEPMDTRTEDITEAGMDSAV